MSGVHGGSSGNKTIKPFRSGRRMDDRQAESILSGLRCAIQQIHDQNASTLSFEELYRNAYNLVLHKHGDKLYDGIESEVTGYLRKQGKKLADTNDNVLLKTLVDIYSSFKTTMKMITDILMYMDRTFVVQTKRAPVYELGLKIFLKEVTCFDKVESRVLESILSKIAAERSGDVIDRDVIQKVLIMLVDLGVGKDDVYREYFENEFMKITKAFYHDEAARYLSSCTCTDYLVHAERRLDQERDRAQTYLWHMTEDRLLRCVAKEMVVNHAVTLVQLENSGCSSMLRDNKVDDLARMYRLFEQKDCRKVIQDCVFEYVKVHGLKLVESDEADIKPVDFVQQLLELQNKFATIVEKAFGGDKSFNRVVKNAFESFVNINERCSCYLSQYLDQLMRNKIKPPGAAGDEGVSEMVDRVIELFRYLSAKDIFENFYKGSLAKRLLSGRSVSEDNEMIVIKKLKTECGNLFTNKLEGMFNDMKLSKRIFEEYQRSLAAERRATGNSSSGSDDRVPDMHVTVLTSGFWPTESVPPCNLPEQIKVVQERFAKHYLSCHNGRRLTWHTSQGTAEMKAYFQDGAVHEFIVSTYQMCILQLFNDGPADQVFTFQQICDVLGVEARILGRHLISLATPRTKILHKEPKGRVLESGTKFWVNSAFKSKHYRIQVPLISSRENIGGAGNKIVVPEQVEENRRHLLEAAIVRIMKARKTFEHSLLIAEVTKQMSSRFKPTPADIKKRLESLLEREYLERTQEDRRVYRYLA